MGCFSSERKEKREKRKKGREKPGTHLAWV
jgi:hypothetical protein